MLVMIRPNRHVDNMVGTDMIASNDAGMVEEWLLSHCYSKTVGHNLPDTWRIPRWFTWHYRPVMLKNARELAGIFWRHLYQSEILLNYYGLEASQEQASRVRHPPGAEYFEDGSQDAPGQEASDCSDSMRPEYAVAFETLSKATANLLKESLIDMQHAEPNASRIVLTERGKSIAADRIHH